ncbi:MAG: hypothetical protein ABSH13_24990 [Candidatus Acidiferrum sp.]|jgi:hypothetical protein
MSKSDEVTFALSPVELYAMLNGESITSHELATNLWQKMPLPPNLTHPNAWYVNQTHFSFKPPVGCWVPPPVKPLDQKTANRGSAAL